ncbi:MAG TPA: methyltransferase domain-containing protein [Armatimonadota bacterium]|jgi:SAM-dependent methyltransferase
MLHYLKRGLRRVLPEPVKLALRRVLGMGPPGYSVDKISRSLQESLRLSYNVAGSEFHLTICLRSLRQGATVVGAPLRGEVLEIGSYPHPGLALALLLSGADRVYINNLTPVANRLPLSYAETIAALLGTFYQAPCTLEELVMPVAGEPHYVELRPGLLTVLPQVGAEALALADDSLDTLFSITVLEHVDDLPAVLGNTFRMLRPGGWCCHDIDLRDHAHLDDAPLDCLRYSEEEYRARGPLSFRHRASDYLREFRAAGFTVAYAGYCLPHRLAGGITDNYGMAQKPLGHTFLPDLEQITPWVTEELRGALHPDFQRYSLRELSVTGLQVVAVKP